MQSESTQANARVYHAYGSGGPYVPMEWASLEQIAPVEPGEVPDGAEGSEQRRQLGVIGMPNDFMRQFWQRRVAFAQRVDPRLTQLMRGFDDLEKLIVANRLALGVDAKFALGGKVAQMSGTLDLARAQDGYKRGATLVINRLEKFWPPCTALATEMEDAIQIFTSLNMYFTPPSSRGFDPHFDYEDVFIVQVQGVKRWRVWEPDPAVGQELLALNDERSRQSKAKSAVPTTSPRYGCRACENKATHFFVHVISTLASCAYSIVTHAALGRLSSIQAMSCIFRVAGLMWLKLRAQHRPCT